MKNILKFVQGVLTAFVFFTLFTLSVCIGAVVMSSGYEYRFVNNEIKRAWMVRLPGYETYLDIDTQPFVYRQRFIMRAYYRVGPWFDPEPAIREEPECKP